MGKSVRRTFTPMCPSFCNAHRHALTTSETGHGTILPQKNTTDYNSFSHLVSTIQLVSYTDRHYGLGQQHPFENVCLCRRQSVAVVGEQLAQHLHDSVQFQCVHHSLVVYLHAHRLVLVHAFFSAWLHQATDKQIKTFLLIWSLTLFMPYCHEFLSHHTLGTSTWNSFGTLYYFAGFNGYMLLGHYLYRNNNRPTGNTVMLSVILFAIGYAVTYVGFREMTSMPDASEEQVEMFFLYCSPNVLLMTVAVFLLVQKTQIHSPLIVSLLANISRCGLGIYMIHYFIVGIGYLIIERLNIPIALQIPLTGILVFLLSWVIVSFAYRFFPRQAKWIMG